MDFIRGEVFSRLFMMLVVRAAPGSCYRVGGGLESPSTTFTSHYFHVCIFSFVARYLFSFPGNANFVVLALRSRIPTTVRNVTAFPHPVWYPGAARLTTDDVWRLGGGVLVRVR